MNAIIQALFDRKSVRSFMEKDICEADRNLILDAAIQAPTAGNQMLYTIIDVRDQAIKDELADSCDDQPFIATAPFVLVFLADCRRWLDCYESTGAEPRKPGVGDFILATQDAMIAAQNAVTAADSLGIGSCYIGDILENHDRVFSLLKLDPYVVPVTLLVFGYPSEQQRLRSKPKRFDRRFIVCKDTYKRLSEPALRAMFKARHPEPSFDFNTYIQAFCRRKYNSDFSKEMTESVQKYIDEFMGD